MPSYSFGRWGAAFYEGPPLPHAIYEWPIPRVGEVPMGMVFGYYEEPGTVLGDGEGI